MVELISEWARKTGSSFFDPRSGFGHDAGDSAPPDDDLIYRLRHWPVLPGALRNAEVLKLLSRMSSRPVRRSWILRHTRLGTARLDGLLQRLAAQQALEVIDPSAFPSARQAG